MTCKPEILRSVPLFRCWTTTKRRCLPVKLKLKTFAARERIYKTGERAGRHTSWSRGKSG